jgi:anti-anti-sigma regulatory factor
MGKGSLIMASNFKISIRRDDQKVQLSLAGDFDGTSACELLNLLEEKCDNVNQVTIHTTGLKTIYPFGKDTFRNNLYKIKDKRIRLSYKGKNANLIAPT